MSITPPALVTGAPRPPLPYGLFSVLVPRTGSADRWEGGGIQLEELGCPPDPASDGIIGPYDCDDGETVGLPKQFASNRTTSFAAPFTVYQSEVCTPIGNGLDRSQQIASGRLAMFEERLVESEVWKAVSQSEVNAAFTEASDKGDILAALAGLEEASAETYGTLGTVHLARALAYIALGYGALEARQNRLYTLLGTPVVAGSGYANDGTAYWTPQLIAYSSEEFTSSRAAVDLLDRSNNDLYAVAEKSWVIGFDTSCGVLEVEEPEPEPEPDPETEPEP